MFDLSVRARRAAILALLTTATIGGLGAFTTATAGAAPADDHQCVVDYLKANARTEQGHAHADAVAACAVPKSYQVSNTTGLAAPFEALTFFALCNAGDVATAGAGTVSAGFADMGNGPTRHGDGWGITVSPVPGTPDGTTGTVTVSAVCEPAPVTP